MTYQETVDYLYSQLPAFQKIGKKAIKPRLTNITRLCEILGNPQDNFKSIHVAGTNGKGSSSHFLTSILMEAGYKTGLYTSPHLKDYRERFRINGKLVPENCVIDFVRDYGQEFQNLSPSFFEVSVALAFKIFSDEKVDVAVIEVGLGGRLDSTNIISKVDLALITNIGYDHTDVLGDTLDKIAYEKAGIIKPGVPVVVSEYLPETRPVFEEKARRQKAPLFFAQDEWETEVVKETIEHLHLKVINKQNGTEYVFGSGLAGTYQKANIRGVTEAVVQLRKAGYEISDTALEAGFRKVIPNTGLKGRWQILGRQPLVICDTGHNDQAFQITINRISREPHRRLYFILGFVKDKDITNLSRYIPEGAIIYLCEFDLFRALKAEELRQLEFENTKNVSIFGNVNAAIEKARQEAGPEDIIFIGGSTYLVAEINDL